MKAADLLAVALAQRESIVARKRKMEAGGVPVLDIEWQFAFGMLRGADELLRAMREALAEEAAKAGT